MRSLFLLSVVLFAQTSGQKGCSTVENTDTGKFTYLVCTDTKIREFADAQDFCQKESGYLPVFPNEIEFQFLISHLNSSYTGGFMFYPGIFQTVNSSDRYSPQTGDFYWVTDNKTKVTKESSTHWLPFSDWIVNFKNLKLNVKQIKHFLMDKEGKVYPKVSITARRLSPAESDPAIVCMVPGVAAAAPARDGPPTDDATQASLELWAIVVIVSSIVLILVLVGMGIGCYVSKKSKFHKVPQQEQSEYKA